MSMSQAFKPARSPRPRDLADATIGALERIPAAAITLALRVGVAAVFFKSGLAKIANWDLTVGLFAEEYRVPLLPPELAAYLGTATELAAPVLIALGLGARFGAAALLVMTLVIQTFVYPGNWSEHLLWAAALAWILSRGAGALSLDHPIRRAMLGG